MIQSNLTRLLFALITLIVFWAPIFHLYGDVHICYFSMNNEKEFHKMREFTANLNRVGCSGSLCDASSKAKKEKIIVTEYQRSGSDPEESFKKMVESGAKCDGLVISGHHTGSFGGVRASGRLSLAFLEEMACDPKYEKWFGRINALWLQGCRTLGVSIETIEQGGTAASADYHTQRVGAVLQEDHLTQSFADLNSEFSSTLDQDNPLSSRYLRIFPSAVVFGWTASAPGVKDRSENSIPFHIAHIASIADDRRNYFEDLYDPYLDLETATRYASTLLGLLNRKKAKEYGCGPTLEDDAIQGWIAHGGKRDVPLPFTFANPDLVGLPPLVSGGNSLLKQARRLDCMLKKDLSNWKLNSVIDEILSDERLLGYSFHSLYEILQRYIQSDNKKRLLSLQKKFKSSPILKKFLFRKLESETLGVLRKIDYYSFYRDMTGRGNKTVERKIRKSFKDIALAPTGDDVNRRDFKETFFQSMAKNGLLDGELLTRIVRSDQVQTDSLSFVARSIGQSSRPIERSGKILQLIIESNKTDWVSLSFVIDSIGMSEYPIKDASKIIQSAIDSDKLSETGAKYVLDSAALAIGKTKYRIKNASNILKFVVNSDSADYPALRQTAQAIERARYPVEDASSILQSIIDSDKADGHMLGAVARAIAYSKFPIKNAAEILRSIFFSDKSIPTTFIYVRDAMKSSISLNGREREQLRKLFESDRRWEPRQEGEGFFGKLRRLLRGRDDNSGFFPED